MFNEFFAKPGTLDLCIAIAAILLVLIFCRPLAGLAIRIVLAGLRRKKPQRYQLVKKVLLRPVAVMIVTGTARIAVLFMGLPAPVLAAAGNILTSLFMIASIWMLYQAAGLITATLLDSSPKKEMPVNATAARLIASSVQIAIILIGILMVLSRWVANVSGLLAGLGIGGLAIALAAQDTAANFIGSIAIMLDKPFAVGDWIEVDAFAGTVENVGLRSSRIRTLDQTLVSIPNSRLASSNVVNGSRRTKRRVAFKFNINQTNEPEAVAAFVERAKAILAADADVEQEGILVYFDGFAANMLEISVSYYTVVDFTAMTAVRERINFTLLRAARELDLSYFPRPAALPAPLPPPAPVPAPVTPARQA
ncbi:MAG TPA: hypothetical protein DD640_10710 [Clostridiales bacterium]|nr:hypothetical protein [Clostridiales bacterium]